MTVDAHSLNGAIAVTRFGLGARPGEIDEAVRDPRGWVRAQIVDAGADQPVGYPLPAPPPPKPATMAPMPAVATIPGAGPPPGMDAAPMGPPIPAPPPFQPVLVSFAPGEPLATMPAAYRSFSLYQEQTKLAKGDNDARKAAAAPLYAAAAEEILARARLAATTPAGFRERWALFWSNHFTVAGKDIPVTVAVGPFEREAIRPHVFGRFEDMLAAASSHPGMMLYLDQVQSIGPGSPAGLKRAGKGGLNENLGREIMELHTVGADAGYTQADVTEFARALTGWTMGGQGAPPEQQGAFLFRANVHEPGPRTVMGRLYAEGAQDQARAVLRDLAASPHTADHLARKIAIHFVADDPPPALVARLRAAYLKSHGDLSQVALALIAAPEAWAPAARKFKTPYEYLISSYRAADAAPRDPGKDIINPLSSLGMKPFAAPQPNGWSETGAEWAAPDAVVKRLTWAQSFAAANTPQTPPPDEARSVLGARLTDKTFTFISRAETRPEAFAILLMSPEFQRR